MKTIIFSLFVLMSSLLSAQSIKTEYDSYLIKIEDNYSAKIYHWQSLVTITDTSVVVTTKPKETLVTLFYQYDIKWAVGVNYLNYNNEYVDIKFYPRTNDLVVTMQLKETTFYGTVPTLIEIKK